ncbi:hypothetical protein Kfla_1241 [Kribbella flavida DSM 17836]|uniref:Uncharacterized protein n=1 Tax=Kribbella flavida (strain DSM 17836 / JCM 10339 / NBRC 14399) TaxID=479435 RepID=D2Q430_KRIFD|nr:hypothetical protein [Kribbella flavida]ADB30344.1 hypothetical protein Kfla_1241 [Kribbella flavida DSM 17836]
MGLLVWRSFATFAGLLGVAAAVMLWTLSSLLGLLLVGGLVTSLVLWCARDGQDDQLGGRRGRFSRSVLHGYLSALAVVAVGGLCSFLGFAGLIVAMIVALTSPPVLRRALALAGRLGLGLGDANEAPRDDVDRVSRMTTAELCRAWTTSSQQLRSGPGTLPVVRLRQLYLDELERRDPVGFNAWLASSASAAGDPSRFLTP